MVRKKTPLRSGKRNELSLVSTKNEWFPCQHSSFGYVRKNVGRRKPVIFTWWDQGRPRRSTAVRQTMISFLFSKRNRMSFVIGCKLLRTSRHDHGSSWWKMNIGVAVRHMESFSFGQPKKTHVRQQPMFFSFVTRSFVFILPSRWSGSRIPANQREERKTKVKS